MPAWVREHAQHVQTVHHHMSLHMPGRVVGICMFVKE